MPERNPDPAEIDDEPEFDEDADGDGDEDAAGIDLGEESDPAPPLDVRRHATRLLLGILLCGVVIAVCVVALIVIVDRFTAPAADDCRKVHCGDSAPRVAG